MTRLGLTFPFLHHVSLPEYRDLAREMEERGYATAWIGEAGGAHAITPRVLDGLGVIGAEAVCRARVHEYVRAGLTMPVIVPFTPEGAAAVPSLLRTLCAFP